MFNTEPLVAGAAPGGLDFVGDEHATMLAHGFSDDAEVLGRGRDEAADSLDGFGDHAGDAAGGGGADEVFDVCGAAHFAIRIGESEWTAVAVGVVGEGDAGGRGPGVAPCLIAGERSGELRAAVIGVSECDDVAVASVQAGGVDGGFVGLGAGVGEHGPRKRAAGRDGGKLPGQLHHGCRGVKGGRVAEGVDLAVDTSVDLVVAVADGNGDDAAEEVEVLAAFGVPHVLVLGAGEGEGLAVEVEDGGKQILAAREQDLVLVHTGMVAMTALIAAAGDRMEAEP